MTDPTPLAELALDRFPLRTTNKLRYADTDRQGHVNNAVFSSLLEDARVELLYDPARPLAEPDGSFVIAKLSLDFLAELTWPGVAEVGTRIAKVGRSSITLEQAIFQQGRRAALALTVIVHVGNTTKRSLPLGRAALEAFAALGAVA
jgi:acyl-CoA thioester hydrolase